MSTFVAFAALLVLGAAALVAWPLLVGGKGGRGTGAAVLAVVVLAAGSAVLYATLSDWDWRAPAPQADSPQHMVGRLARRLERHPDDLDGWLTLGHSYLALEQFPHAARAFQRADRLAGGRNAEALIGLAEALALMDETQLDGRAGRLIEQALALEPRSPKALFYGAAAALRRDDLRTARERFASLLDLGPPENVRPILEKQIAELDERIAGGSQTPAADAPRGEPASGDGAGASAVRVNVSLSPRLRGQAPESAPLFVIVRDPTRPGPPLAVKRLTARLPQTVELTPADAMVAGRAFTAGQQVEVVARIARSGSPLAQSGDPFGEVRYHVGRDGLVDVVIDRLTP